MAAHRLFVGEGRNLAMPLYSEKNLYPGVNAHLNSYLQNETGLWEAFHADHITHLREYLDNYLPPGYFTLSEKSLQIGEFDAGTGKTTRSATKPDVTVYRGTTSGDLSAVVVEEASPAVRTVSILDTFPEYETLSGLVIYQAGEGSVLGRPITRLEVLSPGNKPGKSHFEQYRHKRELTLKSGMRLVEIDYLHTTQPIIHILPSYSDRQPKAVPYIVLVSDPRPTLEQGVVSIFEITVDEPLPTFTVPLTGADYVPLSLGAVYNRTLESSRLFRSMNYAENPPAFDKYTPEDQARITTLLEKIRHDAQNPTPENTPDAEL